MRAQAQFKVAIGALENDSHLRLTPLGFHLAHMPVDARIGASLAWLAVHENETYQMDLTGSNWHRLSEHDPMFLYQ